MSTCLVAVTTTHAGARRLPRFPTVYHSCPRFHISISHLLAALAGSDISIALAPPSCSVAVGKAAAKAALQARLGLTMDPNAPLIGYVGRLTAQKASALAWHAGSDLHAWMRRYTD